ncbi:MAG TPA: carotenoid oxygenase family protein [Micromonosporaceae bacterium]
MSYPVGFSGLRAETTVPDLPVSGALPSWLSGTLIRNGPAVFDHAGKTFRHWFDGQAMLHRFEITEGRVSYANRLLDTPSSRALLDRGRIRYSEFATDPCGSLFSRFFTRFTRKPSPNTAVSVATLAGHDVALTEVPLAVAFDPASLETMGVIGYDDDLAGHVSTAHPHLRPGTGDLINYVLRFGRRSTYQVYRQPAGSGRRELVGSVVTEHPGYVHSFAVTESYAILVIFPLVVNPLSFLLRARPFIENYRWRPELGTRVVVMSLEDGSVSADHTAPPCFAFHHINSFEDHEAGEIVVDLCAFPDAEIVAALYLDRLRAGRAVPMPLPTRIRISAAGVTVAPLSDDPLELPGIDYRHRNGRRYRYAYGTGAADPDGGDFLDQLCKLDVSERKTWLWREPGHYPGEPVFVPAPGPGAEDDGVVLSVVLDAASARSYLLVLDAATFTELGRAEVPHAIPFGFHGRFSTG